MGLCRPQRVWGSEQGSWRGGEVAGGARASLLVPATCSRLGHVGCVPSRPTGPAPSLGPSAPAALPRDLFCALAGGAVTPDSPLAKSQPPLPACHCLWQRAWAQASPRARLAGYLWAVPRVPLAGVSAPQSPAAAMCHPTKVGTPYPRSPALRKGLGRGPGNPALLSPVLCPLKVSRFVKKPERSVKGTLLSPRAAGRTLSPSAVPAVPGGAFPPAPLRFLPESPPPPPSGSRPGHPPRPVHPASPRSGLSLNATISEGPVSTSLSPAQPRPLPQSL